VHSVIIGVIDQSIVQTKSLYSLVYFAPRPHDIPLIKFLIQGLFYTLGDSLPIIVSIELDLIINCMLVAFLSF